MAVTTTNLVLGPANLYVAEFGATETALTTLSALSGAVTAVGWTDLGGTNDGVTLTIAQEYTELEVDQIVDLPESRITSRRFTIETNLAELTLANLDLALGGGSVPVTAGGTMTYEPASGNSGASPKYKCLIVDGYAPGGLRRRIIIRKVLSVEDVEFAYNKEDQAVYSVTFSAHYVSEAIKPFKIIDALPA